MTRATDSNDPPLLELPLAVLAPRRAHPDGPRRFGQSKSSISTGESSLPPLPPLANDQSGGGHAGVSASETDPDGQDPAHLRLLIGYIVAAFTFQVLLLLPWFSMFRLPLRMFPFATSLILATFPPRKLVSAHRPHPALAAAFVVIVICVFGLINQETEGMLSGIATVAFYAAILAPLIWVGRLQISQRGFVSVVVLIWALSTLSSGVGILQVAFPGRFKPATSQIFLQQQQATGIELKINLANGEEMERPYGLTDQPGGVCSNGVAAFVFGLGLLSTTRRPHMVLLYAAGMGAGLFVIYLCQVRVALVTCGIAAVGYVALLISRGEVKQVTRVLIALGIVVSISTVAALAVGGAQVADRILSLTADDASKVYYGNRGRFLEETFVYILPRYPAGAGLGRYGMIANYFAADKGLGPHALWSEIQWTAWAYDGGWLMIFAYPLALGLALWMMLRLAFDRKAGSLSSWGTILAAYNVSAIAITFSYSLFLSQTGMEFWILNALLYSAYQIHRRHAKAPTPEGFEVVPSVWRPGITMPAPVPARSAAPVPFGSKRRALSGRTLPAVRVELNSDGAGQS